VNAPQSSSPSATSSLVIIDLYCPLCGGRIDRFGSDASGTHFPHCRKCKNHREVRIADGKIVIELNLPGVYSADENSGGHPQRD
jgi:hypothetical protein